MPKETKLDENAEIYQRRESKTLKEQLNTMSPKDKCKHLWTYYKVHAAIIIAVIGSLTYIIYQIVTPNIETELNVVMIDSHFEDLALDQAKEDFTQYMQLDPKTQEVIFNNSITSQNSYMLSAFIAANELDVIIAPESKFYSYAYYDNLANLSEQLPTDLYTSLTKDFYICDREDDPEQNVYGVYLTDTSLYQKSYDMGEPYILGIVVNSKQKENAVEFIRYLFQ